MPPLSCFPEGLRPWYCGISIPDRHLSYPVTLLFLSLPPLSCFSEGLRPWYCGISIPDRNLSYPATLLFLTLSHSGKGPCIRHTYKRVQWEVGSRYINPIQPYRFCRQLYLCYQDRLCAIIQLDYEIVMVVIWFPCWSPGWSMGWDIYVTLLFFYPTAPRTSCLGSPVARYNRPFEARTVDSTRRASFQQLSACSSPPFSGWFAPVLVPPGSPAALGPLAEPRGGGRPRTIRKPHRGRP